MANNKKELTTSAEKERGIWSRINKIVREMKSAGRFAIERRDVSDKIDPEELDPEYCVKFYIDFISSCVLWENNYRSVVRGKNVYVDIDALKSPDIRDRLQQNIEMDIKYSTVVFEMLDKLPIPQSEGKQGAFTNNENGEPVFFEELSSNELLELLISLQRES